MNLIRPMAAPCKDCHQLPTLNETLIGIVRHFQLICTQCSYKTDADTSVIAVAILWNLYNTGAVDINVSPIQ